MKPVIALRNVPHEGLGTIADALVRASLRYKIIDACAVPSPRPSSKGKGDVMEASPKKSERILPPFNPHDWAGLIVMGGPMNVDQVDRYPALADEVAWLQQAVAARLPVLGVCLGSQLLAKALGSKVYANRIKEIGWYDVELLQAADDDPLFHNLHPLNTGTLTPTLSQREREQAAEAAERNIGVFQWHGDTFDLPAGAVQLARSEQCENQAFRFGESAYGLQFHMEVTADIINDWLCEGGNCGELAALSYINPAAIRQQTPHKLPPMEEMGRKVFDWFAFMCKTRSS